MTAAETWKVNINWPALRIARQTLVRRSVLHSVLQIKCREVSKVMATRRVMDACEKTAL